MRGEAMDPLLLSEEEIEGQRILAAAEQIADPELRDATGTQVALHQREFGAFAITGVSGQRLTRESLPSSPHAVGSQTYDRCS